MELLQREVRLQQIVKLVGPDALPDSQNFIIEICTLFKNAFLQQNAFDENDRYSTVEKQIKMLSIILRYWELGSDLIAKGVTLVKFKRMRVIGEIARMRLTVANDNLDELDKIELRLERSMNQIGGIYEQR